jgi:pyruvate ferredoxin oxidoreductase beta subunit
MSQFSVYLPKLLTKDEFFLSGRRSCQGCGKALAARLASKTIRDAAAVSAPAALPGYPSAASFTAQSYAYDELTCEPLIENLLAAIQQINASAPADAHKGPARIKKAVVGLDRKIFASEQLVAAKVFTQSSAVLYLCFDNEPHIDRLIRRLNPPAFKLAEISHPLPGAEVKAVIREKNIPAAVSEGRFSYIATACPSYPLDFIEKVKKALACSGNAFISVLSPCPTGWVFVPKLTVKVGALAVKTGYFPLYEVENGRVRITQSLQNRKPVQDYLKMQKRFFTFPQELIPVVQEAVNEECAELLQQAQA